MTDAFLDVFEGPRSLGLPARGGQRLGDSRRSSQSDVPQAHTSRHQEPTSTMVAAVPVYAARMRLDGDFISERLHGKRRFLHANVDRG